MISSFPSYDEEPLNSAYANIGLIADKAWNLDGEDPFQKLNRSLWVQHRKVTARYKENVNYRAKRVRDVIPDSRLATYGNYEYDEEREAAYKPDDEATPDPLPNFCWTEVTEPWMLSEVEKHLAWLTSGVAQSNRELLAIAINVLGNMAKEWFEYGLGSAIREPKADDAPKLGCVLKPSWDDCLQGPRIMQRLSPTEKKHRSRNESHSIKETSVIESDSIEKVDNRYEHRRYTIENPMEMQLHVRVTSEAVQNLWKPANNSQQRFVQQRTRLQCYQGQQQPVANSREQHFYGKERPQQLYYAFQYRPLILRTEYQTARTEAYGRKHLQPVLSPEVPEFFPKVPVVRFNGNKEQNRVQYFPSLNERSYQNELFPYNRTHENPGTVYQNTGIPLLPVTDTAAFLRAPQQWYQRVPPTTQIQISNSTSVQPLRTTTVAHHPLQVQDKFLQSNPIPIPVYQHPIELYHETGQKRKNQGVDFKNLILLTKNAMKAHRGQSKQSQQKPAYILETRNRSKSDANVFQWLDKSCSSKTKDHASANTLLTELRSFDRKSVRKAFNSRREKDGSRSNENAKTESGGQGTRAKSNEMDKNEIRNRRRLYRDVLTNASANQAMLENVFEKRYDELEQQAMEQYRTSEESLALKYQELERQAMEQYRCCGNVQEDVTVSQGSMDDRKTGEESVRSVKDKSCFDGQKCSGFGRCSPVNIEETEKDPFLQNQANLAKAESKSESGSSDRTLCNANIRSTVLSKSVTSLSQKISYRSKNTAKGASVSVRASSKRRLILVSPFEKESEAKLTRTTDLEEFYCIAQGNRNLFGYYNNSKVGRIGGGDENIAFLQSPKTEVWLSGFWTT